MLRIYTVHFGLSISFFIFFTVKYPERNTFQHPLTNQWEIANEYLSGNVRDKLEIHIWLISS